MSKAQYNRYALSMKNYLFILLILFAPVVYPLSTLIADEEEIPYENQQVEKIEIEAGFVPEGSQFDDNGILARLKVKEGDYFSHAAFDNDLKTLSQDFDRLEPTVKSVDGKIYITLIVWPKATIRSIWL